MRTTVAVICDNKNPSNEFFYGARFPARCDVVLTGRWHVERPTPGPASLFVRLRRKRARAVG